MSELILGKRYARALLEAAREKQTVAEVEQELQLIVSSIRSNAEFLKIWEHRAIAVDVKQGLIQQAFEGKVSEIVLNTVLLIIEKGREAILEALLESYVEQANESLGQAVAVVHSASALSDKEKEQVAQAFGQLTGKKVNVENIVNPELIGGLKVRIGDMLYDGSVSGQLQRLEQSLALASTVDRGEVH